MSRPPSPLSKTSLAPRGSRNAVWIPIALAAVGLAYAFGHLAWYRTTPLGQTPVLDEQENLLLGEAIVRGELPREPFYRAMGYPLLLAVLRLFVEPANLFAAALAIGALLHGLNSALVAATAQSWFGRLGAIAAGLLYALNPVLVHYATQALDATPALSLFLVAVALLAGHLASSPVSESPSPDSGCRFSVSRWALASLALAAATVFRPNYLLAWLALPLLAVLQQFRPIRIVRLGSALSGAALFIAIAGWQWRVSGAVGFLPWQGAYNLWAANAPDAHGRYFAQRVQATSDTTALNPTRDESFALYQRETGSPAPDITSLNTHWRRRFLEHITAHPIDWLGLLARKTYALLNDWDQYNNKTYAFHQALSPWLRWNPLGWGVLFTFAAAGTLMLLRQRPEAARFVLILAVALGAGILLFYVSGRFRLPLAALAAILAGGIFALDPSGWKRTATYRWRTSAALVVAAALTFSHFDHVRDARTYVEDHALLARAAERTGDFDRAWREADAALGLNPQHPDAQRVAVVAYFNQLVRQGSGPGSEARWLEISRAFLKTARMDAAELQAIAAIAIWRANQRVAAVEEWKRLGSSASAIACRLLVRDRTLTPDALQAAPIAAWNEPLVRLAAAHLAIAPPSGVRPGDPRRATEILQTIFAPEARAVAP